jgi:type I restriction enzyme M protein
MPDSHTLSPRHRRAALAALSRDRLAALTEHYQLDVGDRRQIQSHIDALIRARRVDFADVLEKLQRNELKDICAALGLDTSGREKQVIIARILGRGDGAPEHAPDDTDDDARDAAPRQAELPLARSGPAGAAGPASSANPPARAKRGRPARASGNGRDPDRDNRASLGFEARLWEAADLMRNNMDPAEYKHVVLGLIFLKYISDSFDARQDELRRLVADPEADEYIPDPTERARELAALLDERDSYTEARVFWVPPQARWAQIQASARQPDIGTRLDAAMDAIEAENPSLRGALPKIYALPNLDRQNLGKLIDVISGIGLAGGEHRGKDTLGRVYEYFLSRFASAEGKGGGEFYTPTSVVRLLVEMIEPYHGRVYDPCCGSGGMFVQSLKLIEAHHGRREDVTIYGQESNYTTWRLARMNLAIRGIEANLGPRQADSFHSDLHPGLEADFILANPPFNVSDWGGERLRDDARWRDFGVPPAGNANFAWVQHFIWHLADRGAAGFVLANGSMSSMQSGEGEIRRKIVEADLVDCMVALPGQLFYSTQIPVCLWFLSRDRSGGGGSRKRLGEVLFIDARQLGRMETRVHRVLDDAEIARVSDTYHAWQAPAGTYQDVPGFCKSATLDEIRAHDFVLTPGRYVGAADAADDDEPFEKKMARLVTTLEVQVKEGRQLDEVIRKNLRGLGYGG